MEYGIVFYFLIFIIAALYSSVGHGGARRASALILNLFVSAISFYAYYRGGYFRLKLLWPFILLSVPMSFIGARVSVDPAVYRIILAVFLVLAVFRMLFSARDSVHIRPVNIPLGVGLGAVLAAVSAIFIFLNSASGIAGLASSGGLNPVNEIYLMLAAGITGSFAGSWIGQAKLTPLKLTYLLAGVLLFASYKLIYL